MIGVLQRVRQARVEIQGEVVGAIDHGIPKSALHQHGVAQLGVAEVAGLEARGIRHYVLQVCALQVGSLEVGTIENSTTEVCAAEVIAGQGGLEELRLLQIAPLHIGLEILQCLLTT